VAVANDVDSANTKGNDSDGAVAVRAPTSVDGAAKDAREPIGAIVAAANDSVMKAATAGASIVAVAAATISEANSTANLELAADLRNDDAHSPVAIAAVTKAAAAMDAATNASESLAALSKNSPKSATAVIGAAMNIDADFVVVGAVAAVIAATVVKRVDATIAVQYVDAVTAAESVAKLAASGIVDSAANAATTVCASTAVFVPAKKVRSTKSIVFAAEVSPSKARLSLSHSIANDLLEILPFILCFISSTVLQRIR